MTTSKTTTTGSQTPTSNACECHEADLSAILDGELSTVDLTGTLDHLVDCRQCAEFYRRSRELDRAVAASQADSREEAVESAVAVGDTAIAPSSEVWRRIAERAPWTERRERDIGEDDIAEDDATREPSRFGRRHRRLMEWAPRLAAIFVLGFGLWMVHLVTRDAGSGEFFRQASESSVDVLSEEDLSESRIGADAPGDSATDSADMDEERFVELASEVLMADPRFHYEMLEVMKSATRSSTREGSVDYRRGDEGFSLTGTRDKGDRTSDGRVWQ